MTSAKNIQFQKAKVLRQIHDRFSPHGSSLDQTGFPLQFNAKGLPEAS
jgi:hypothetical protein